LYRTAQATERLSIQPDGFATGLLEVQDLLGARWWTGDTIPSGLRSRVAMAIASLFATLSLP
jgi:hypothetical protein